jgi:membrane protein YdbS with pleckstrin-like domain
MTASDAASDDPPAAPAPSADAGPAAARDTGAQADAAVVEPTAPSPIASDEPPTEPELPAAPSIADGVRRPLDPRIVPLQRTVGWITWAVMSGPLFGGATIATLVAWPRVWVAVLALGAATLVSGLLAWSAHAWPPIEHRHASYTVDHAGIEIRRGVVWRRILNVARSRVQHTDVSQGPLERRWGLARLLIYTAGTDHARVELPGLAHETALLIRDHLLPGGGDDAV